MFVKNATNASRTTFVNLHSLRSDDGLLDLFELDRTNFSLPGIGPSFNPEAFGCIASGPLKDKPITGCLGDQSAALVGQCAF